MNHIMIDLETFGTRPGSMIVSIGAVIFDPHSDAVGGQFHTGIRPESRAGTIDPSTVMWWMQQADAARAALIQRIETGENLGAALLRLHAFISTVNPPCVWGNGATFDIAMLEDAFTRERIPIPWEYRGVRCFRTIASELSEPYDWVKPTIAHDALADAIAQAKTLQNIYARLERGRCYALMADRDSAEKLGASRV